MILPGCPSDPVEPKAYFAPSDQWRRPSDYVAHLAHQFEEGKPDPITGKIERRPLKRDQVLFIAQFADSCNAVWEDEQNDVPVKKRRRFSLLLMGQGGTGKTAIVQDIVLPAIDFLFPPPAALKDESAALIVCAKWSQAENISTDAHKAVSCHRACLLGVQSYRNCHILPRDKTPALRRVWDHKRLLVIEEVSMISPPLYNMLLYRSYHGRARTWEIPEHEYDKFIGAFGRMPIVVHLGDFLQLKPTGSNISLLTDLRKLEAAGELHDYPAEYQMAAKLFCQTPLCFELQATNRFKCDRLRDLMAFMRHPERTLPANIAAHWHSIALKVSDARLAEERFQTGHMLAIYWDTVARWMMMRAQRDAAALQVPLFLLQAADVASPLMPRDLAAKIMNVTNPKGTGGLHGMLPVHVGMHIRLLAPLDLSQGLVKDAEGEVVQIVPHPADQALVNPCV